MNIQRKKKLSNGYVMNYMVHNLFINDNKIVLLLDNSVDNIRIVNDIQHKEILNNEVIEFAVDGNEYIVHLSYLCSLTSDILTGTSITVYFYGVNKKTSSWKASKEILFLVPYLDASSFMQKWSKNPVNGISRDNSTVTYRGRSWKFRLAYNELANPMLYSTFSLLQSKSKYEQGLFIAVTPAEGDSFDDLKIEAMSICQLLGFSLGKYTKWQSVWSNSGSNLVLEYIASMRPCAKEAKRPLTAYVHSVGRTHIHCENPIEFIEKSCFEYAEEIQWWRTTLDWCISSKSANFIQISKMIESMLFNRLQNKVFSDVINIAIHKDLSQDMSAKEIKKIAKSFDNKLCSALPKSKEEIDFINMCKQWIAKPDYINGISVLFEFAGAHISSNDRAQLRYRHNIVHNGEIPIRSTKSSILNYDCKIAKHCFSLILSSIGYGDYFSTNEKTYCVSKLLPRWKRLMMSNIKRLATKLLS